MPTSPQTAIDAALSQKWGEAISINKELLKGNSDDMDALCRLAYAYTQTGQIDKAKKIYRKVLNLDRYNSVALKNLHKISSITNSKNSFSTHQKVPPSLFIEEPGKTKIVQLINLAPSKIISLLCIGDTVLLHPKKHAVEIRGTDKTYYGALPGDVAFRLLKFLSAGNTYLACIKNIQKNSVSIFIRELTRGKKLHHQPTFTPVTMKEFNPSIGREIKNKVFTDETEEENQEEEDV